MRGACALLVLLVLSSTASASWKALGGLEPGTLLDQDTSLMFPDPDTSNGAPLIYFQAFQSVEQLTLNPNVAATHSRMLPPGAVNHRALLGVWKDCNRDGYIGHAESALLDYSAALLRDTNVCPPEREAYNDGQWVSEMIGIGMVDPCEYPREDGTRPTSCDRVTLHHRNERVWYADGTMVWADVGKPGASPERECPMAPLPPATTSSTGALLGYADCQDARLIATTVNSADPNGSRGLRFEDPEHPERSSSVLNVRFPVTLFGGPQGRGLLEAGTGARSATVWDCGAPKLIDVRDPTGGLLSEVVVSDPSGGRLTGAQPALPVVGVVTVFANDDEDASTPGRLRVRIADGEGSLVWAPRPAPAPHAPTASSWDTLEHVADGPRADCDPNTPSPLRAGAPGAIAEGGDVQIDEARKDRASMAFTFYDGHRGLNEGIDFLLGETTPSDGGVLLFRHGRGGVGPLWSADAPSVNEPQVVTRGSLAFAGPRYWTYYAAVGTDAFARGARSPGSGDGRVYGSEACGSFTSGEHNGWVCDASRWWRDALGRDVRPRYVGGDKEGNVVHYAPVPGQRYHLRDVDCYDGHVAAGVFVSGVVLAPGVCV